MKWIKKIFRRLTPREVAAQELADAELSLLEALTAQEYSASVVEYNRKRISRLKNYLRAEDLV